MRFLNPILFAYHLYHLSFIIITTTIPSLLHPPPHPTLAPFRSLLLREKRREEKAEKREERSEPLSSPVDPGPRNLPSEWMDRWTDGWSERFSFPLFSTY